MTAPLRILGLYSPAPQSGKTTVAKMLARHGYTRLSFAHPLKEMTTLLLRHLGYSWEQASDLVFTDKNALLPEIKTTPRHILQTLGTEFGRQCIHPDLWLICWRNQAEAELALGNNVVVDDVRFPNEADLVRSLGGQLWSITRTGVTNSESHPSEGGLNAYPEFDYRITNDGTLSDLQLAVAQKLGLPLEVA
jgi:hypothetical protein